MLTLAQRNEVYKRVYQLVKLGNEIHNTDLESPHVRFDKRGTCGGTACYSLLELNFNAGLMVDNWEEYINQVIPHEVAHLLKDHIHGTSRRGPGSSHGRYWQNIMRKLGVDPDRTHSMDTSKVAMPKRKYIYECEGCGKELVISSVRHNKIARGQKRYSHCRGSFIVIKKSLGLVTNEAAHDQKTPNFIKKAVPKAGTRINKIMSIYTRYVGCSRQEMITYIVSEMESQYNETLTRTQAAGYFQTCKKKVG